MYMLIDEGEQLTEAFRKTGVDFAAAIQYIHGCVQDKRWQHCDMPKCVHCCMLRHCAPNLLKVKSILSSLLGLAVCVNVIISQPT